MAEFPFAKTGDAKTAAAIGIGTGNLGIGGHPVIGMCVPLFGGQKREQRGERVHRHLLLILENQQFAFHTKTLAFDMTADRGAITDHRFHAQVIKPEAICVLRRAHVSVDVLFGAVSRCYPVVNHMVAGFFKGCQTGSRRQLMSQQPKGTPVTQPDSIALSKDLTIRRALVGLWQVADIEKDGDIIDPELGADHLQAYAEAGFDTFDMADHYGTAEIITGALLKRGVDAKVCTKWCPVPGPMTADVVRAGVKDRLDRLGVERVDLLQFHWWSFEHPAWLDALHEMAKLREEGLIGEIGLTNFDAAHLHLALADGIPIVSNQVPFSLLDRRAAGPLSAVCAKWGVKLLGYGTLQGGFLSEKWLGQPEPAEITDWSKMKYKRFIDTAGGWDVYQTVLQAAADVAAKHGVSVSNVATRWVLENDAVAGVIIGARLGEARHTADNLKLFRFSLDAEDHARLNAAFDVTMPLPGDCGDEYRKPPFLTASGDLSHHLDTMPLAVTVEDVPGRPGEQRVLSGSEWEDIAGYCRAHRIGDRILVSGTTATAGLNRAVAPQDAGAQTTFILDKIGAALTALGGTLEDVVRTRVYLSDADDVLAVSRAHGRVFGAIKPANTLFQIGQLIGDYTVEIEAEAIVRPQI